MRTTKAIFYALSLASASLLLFKLGELQTRNEYPVPLVSQISFGVNAPVAMLRGLIISSGVLHNPLIEKLFFFFGCALLWMWVLLWMQPLRRRGWPVAWQWISAILALIAGGAMAVVTVMGTRDVPRLLMILVGIWAVFLDATAILSLVQLVRARESASDIAG